MMHMNFNKRKAKLSCVCLRATFCIVTFFLSINVHAEVALGDTDAPVTIIEYGSLTCDYCVKFHREVLPLIESRHIEKGNVRFIYRDFPTSTAATKGAIARRCTTPDLQYTMLKTLYANVEHWSQTRNVDKTLVQHAVALGLDAETFRACLNDPQHVQDLDEDKIQASKQYAVEGTPTFIINDKIVRGFKDVDEINTLQEEASLEIKK